MSWRPREYAVVKTGLKLQSSRQYDLDLRIKSETCGFTRPGFFYRCDQIWDSCKTEAVRNTTTGWQRSSSLHMKESQTHNWKALTSIGSLYKREQKWQTLGSGVSPYSAQHGCKKKGCSFSFRWNDKDRAELGFGVVGCLGWVHVPAPPPQVLSQISHYLDMLGYTNDKILA